MKSRTPVCWSNDDIHWGQTAQMQRQLELLEKFEVPGTFFLVPKWQDHTLDQDAALLALLKQAAARQGHEYGQHGYVHDPYESGIPDLMMLQFSPDVRERFTDDRFNVEAMQTLPAMKQMVAKGRAIWKRAFQTPARGYRPGWGAFSGNLYRACERLGFDWVSARCASRTSWVWNQGEFSYPDTVGPVGYAPFRMGRLVEYPLAGDYAFHVKKPNIRKFANLGWAQFQACRKLGVAFNVVSHWHGLMRNGDTGYAVHEILLKRLRDSGQAEFMTMSDYHDRWVKRHPVAQRRS